MDTALVTGAAGFMGSHVADHVSAFGLKVVALDDLSGGFRRNLDGNVDFQEESIEDERLVEELFARHGFRYVYHLAAYAAEGLSPFIRHFNYSVNLIGNINLINAAVNHGTECFVFTSSIAVYGTNPIPYLESTVPLPEMVQQAMGRDLGLEYLPPRHEVQDAVSDHRKVRQRLGYRPAVDPREGLARTVAWASSVEPAPPRAVSKIEIARNLPPSWARFTRRDPGEPE